MRTGSDGPLGAALMDVLLFDTIGWERRRRRGRRAFIRQVTAAGWLALAVVITSVAARILQTGSVQVALRVGPPPALLALGALMPLVLRVIAPIEWRLLEARYARELARTGRVAIPVVE